MCEKLIIKPEDNDNTTPRVEGGEVPADSVEVVDPFIKPEYREPSDTPIIFEGDIIKSE